jgi:hypothetical protein
MPIVSGRIRRDGALVKVRLAWSTSDAQRQRAALKPIPPPVEVMALLDSGAEATALDVGLVRSLGLPVAGITLANAPGVGGLNYTSQHEVDLTVLHRSGNPSRDLIVRDLMVIELNLGQLGYQALIGRDVLAGCRFLYDGPQGRFKVAY